MLRVARAPGRAARRSRSRPPSSARMPCRRSTRAAPTTTSTCVVDEMLPAVAAEGLADAVDAFCERIAFTPEQTERGLRRGAAPRPAGEAARRPALRHGRRGAGRALRRALGRSPGVRQRGRHRRDGEGRHGRRAAAGRLLLPARDAAAADRRSCARPACRSRSPPTAIRAPRRSTSLLLMLNMACTLFRMTPEEALAGVTREARPRARAGADRRHARASARWPISRSGTSRPRPSSPTGSAPTRWPSRCTAGRGVRTLALPSLWHILRDAAHRAAPQDEVFGFVTKQETSP